MLASIAFLRQNVITDGYLFDYFEGDLTHQRSGLTPVSVTQGSLQWC